MEFLASFLQAFRRIEKETRPFDPEKARLLKKRWDGLPELIKTKNQILGMNSTGCEGTQGMFPKCDLACHPCYHSKNANRVPIDGPHTLRELEKQLIFLSAERGEHYHYMQLIGGEVTLLGPRYHAEALLKMQSYHRIPMSFTHGDFEEDYLEKLIHYGRGKIKHLSFAGHFDATMVGRKGIKQVKSEKELYSYRKAFYQKFEKIRKKYKVNHFLAHNITITSKNMEEIPEVIRQCREIGFRLVAFQPSAQIGNEKRWSAHLDQEDEGDTVWSLIEKGVGRKLPYTMTQFGDFRCNRTVWGGFLGEKYVPLFENNSRIDQMARDSLREMGALGLPLFRADRPWRSAIVFLRAMLSEKKWIKSFLCWLARFILRAGPLNLMRYKFKTMTLVMHRFMDAADVKEAVKWNDKQQWSPDKKIRETQERLQACVYSMAHPDQKKFVPACVQHGLLDEKINGQLIQKLKRK